MLVNDQVFPNMCILFIKEMKHCLFAQITKGIVGVHLTLCVTKIKPHAYMIRHWKYSGCALRNWNFEVNLSNCFLQFVNSFTFEQKMYSHN